MAGNDMVDYAVEHLVKAELRGGAPHACNIITFGPMWDHNATFPAQDYRNVELQLTGESGAGAIRVVTQQLRM